MPDKWGDYHHQDKIWDGVTYHVKYLGNTLVAELDEEGQSYGDSISADAVKTIVAMVCFFLIYDFQNLFCHLHILL